MNTAIGINVVHEFGAQCQSVRVKSPARIRYIDTNREGVDVRLLDLSAGGFASTTSDASIQLGDLYKGKLLFQIGSISFFLEVGFQVRSVDPANRRAGCRFQSLKPREVTALRYLITSYLAGEAIGVGDMLNTLQRENFTKARKQSGSNGRMDFFGRVRAVTLSIAIFAVRADALAFILNRMYSLYFVTHADFGVVNVPSQQITMPHEGTVQSLLGSNVEVAKDVPIATFSANPLDMLEGNLTEEQLNSGSIEKPFDHQVKGALTSSYNRRVVQQLVVGEQYTNKGQVIFTLAPRDSVANVEARFPYRNVTEPAPDTRVNFQVVGDGVNRSGRIVSTAPMDGDLSSEIRAQIQLDQPPDAQHAGCPTEISIGDLLGHALLNGAVAPATAH